MRKSKKVFFLELDNTYLKSKIPILEQKGVKYNLVIYEILNTAKINRDSLEPIGFGLSPDFTQEVYNKRKCLFQNLKLARSNGHEARIVNNNLVVHEKKYAYVHLTLRGILHILNATEVNVTGLRQTKNVEIHSSDIEGTPVQIKSTKEAEDRKRKLDISPEKLEENYPKTIIITRSLLNNQK